ncbi:hypothetical protein EAMG_04599 [Escherichia coli M056]|nr:hypothetical protein EAMG_04599 [Escherichia coli M056]
MASLAATAYRRMPVSGHQPVAQPLLSPRQPL